MADRLTRPPTWRRVRDGTQSVAPLLVRSRVLAAIREFFAARDFLEVETPLLVRHPGMEPHLEIFQTELVTARGQRAAGFLTTSPEYAMKKLLAAGQPRIVQIGKAFRNREEISSRHNPEFTILEWYRADADYRALMQDCEALLGALVGCRASTVDAGSLDPGRLTYQGEVIDVTPPWPRVSVREAFARHAAIDLDACLDLAGLASVAASRGYQVDPSTTWEQLYHQIFLNEIEGQLGRPRPTILYDYPVSMAALSRPSQRDPRYAERFELYVAGIELGNAFSELIDPIEQRRRLEAEQRERAALGRVAYGIDLDFIAALEAGLPPCAGIAIGVDRLAMLVADARSIRDVIWFPADELFDLQ